ncbi:MAG: hypothetical protein V1821_04250, partial [bacterium]
RLADVLKPGGTIALTPPAYKLGSRFVEFPKADLFPKNLQITPPPGPKVQSGAVTYKRADQFVGREIVVLRKV